MYILSLDMDNMISYFPLQFLLDGVFICNLLAKCVYCDHHIGLSLVCLWATFPCVFCCMSFPTTCTVCYSRLTFPTLLHRQSWSLHASLSLTGLKKLNRKEMSLEGWYTHSLTTQSCLCQTAAGAFLVNHLEDVVQTVENQNSAIVAVMECNSKFFFLYKSTYSMMLQCTCICLQSFLYSFCCCCSFGADLELQTDGCILSTTRKAIRMSLIVTLSSITKKLINHLLS